ncbi:MAG: hypothetical protein J7M20_10660 [Deltaproteobacteria bacterium]|nr:hypothetical protein [Deltaproteobacteria bacterium]
MLADEKEDVLNAISDLGLNFKDFEFNEIDLTTYKENSVSPIHGEIKIIYKPLKVTRKYKTGHGSSWPAKFEFDLKTNFYGTR